MDPADEPVKAEGQSEAGRLIASLQALYDADRAVLELIALGPVAIPYLSRFLVRREPSGLYQPRVLSVAALAALKAEDVLLDFLRGAPDVDIVDPVERTGEDAVINAAARALSHRRDDEAFAAFVGIAERRCLAGVVEALGEMRRKKAIPYLIEGLASDFCRPVAEMALRKFGAAARPALIGAALNAIPSVEFESVTSLRTRRSAVTVLRDTGVTLEQWSVLQPLMWSTDKWLPALACSLGLAPGQPTPDQEGAVRRLFHLLRSSDWLLTVDIESWLAENYEVTNRAIAELFERGDPVIQEDKVRQSLLRVTAWIAKAGLAVGSHYAPPEKDASAGENEEPKLSLSGALPIADRTAPHRLVRSQCRSRSSAASPTAQTVRSSSWPRRLVSKLDDALRRFYSVQEFSDRPGCLLRIVIRRAAAGVRLAEGYEVAPGAEIIEFHLWNEHLSSLASGHSSLGRAAALRRQIDTSLCELADHIEFDPALAGIVALRARTALVPRKRLGKLLRIASAYGFDSVASDAPDPLVTRLHDFCENFLIWALVWTFNPNALRRNGLLRSRCELWISRGALMSRYRPSIDESTVAEGATSSSPRAASISNFPSLPWPGESAAGYCANTRDYLKEAG